LPTLVVIDASGRIAQASVGLVGASEIESAIASAATQPQP
jgi:hypothetical protein